MSILQLKYDSQDDIPEAHRELFTEREGGWELTGVTGMRTQADVDSVTESLNKERSNHSNTKKQLDVWGEYNFDEVKQKLDKYPELEAAAEGKLDEKKFEEAVVKRLEVEVNAKTGALEKERDNLIEERDKLQGENKVLLGEKRSRIIRDSIQTELVKAKVLPEAYDDAFLWAEQIFEIREEDNKVVTRDSVGVTPGLAPDLWLSDIKAKKPHWWPESEGGGAGGGTGGTGGTADNPWTKDHWNLTRQGQLVRENPEKAEHLAKSAGSYVGALRPS